MKPSRILSREIEQWLARNFLIAPGELLKAATFALLSLAVIDRPDNRHEITQQIHKTFLKDFADKLAAWKANA